MEIGEKIKSIRERRGLDQSTLAERINISQSKMNKIETGYQKRLEPEIIRDIAKELNVTADELLGVEKRDAVQTDNFPFDRVGISREDFENRSAYQQEVLQWAASPDGPNFLNRADNIEDMMEQLEIGYEVYKAMQRRKKDKQ